MKKVLAYLKGYKKECICAPLFKMLEATFELFVPLVMAAVIDTGIGNGDKGYVIRMCLIHDLGECFTGDIPSFLKTEGDEQKEQSALRAWTASLPEPFGTEMQQLYEEMDALQTQEAKLYKALDKLEAIIQHNEADIQTWQPLEYDLNLTYADDAVAFSPYLRQLREAIREDTKKKISENR